jgi:hypothetical protein
MFLGAGVVNGVCLIAPDSKDVSGNGEITAFPISDREFTLENRVHGSGVVLQKVSSIDTW